MASLVGIYRSPDIARVEQDDEARRALDEIGREGGQVLGSFDRNAGEEDIDYFFGVITDWLERRGWE